MTDRFFPNELPDFVAETETISEKIAGVDDSLAKLLCMPYPQVAQKLKQAALDLKDEVVKETWTRAGWREKNFSLYTGSLGTALLLFKAYQVTNSKADLSLCFEMVKACDSASRGSDYVTFICGRAGVCAVGAVAAKHAGDKALMDHYLAQFNKGVVVKEMIKDGVHLAGGGSCPLMYEWHGKKYWGAAHGLAGIMHVLMDMELKPEDEAGVKGTLSYMIQNRFPSENYPSRENSRNDHLVHWCHGAPGVVLTLAKAAQVFHDAELLKAAVDAGEVVWNRGLLKRVGICHGMSGNAYVFLSLYRLTGNIEFLYRAKAFACFLLDKANTLITEGKMHGGDHPFSLFEGLAGMAYLFLDMIEPSKARFPAYEL